MYMKNIHWSQRPKLFKFLLIIALLFVSYGHLFAQISMSVKSTTLGQIINTVKKQTKYQFFYEDKLSKIQIESVNVKNISLEKLLDTVLKDKGVTYKIEDKIVYLSPANTKPASVKQQKKGKSITGIVVDQSGDPLIGVSVAVKGTSVGTMTDLNGKYVLDLSDPKADLTFSFVGYKMQIHSIAKNDVLNVTLQEDVQTINEVVVTALGIKREKKMLGYAIQELKADQINKTGDPSLTSALQGKVAGLQMNMSSTGLSGSTKITLRGNSSLVDNNQPLWVIDGVPFSDNNTSGASLFGGVDRGSTAVDINPDDVESISVLKGPNASALYGSRAGNGVILVTTKKGTKQGGFGVTYNNSLTWTKVAETLNMQDKYGQGTNGIASEASHYSFGGLLDGHEYTAWNGEKRNYQKYGDKLKDYFSTGFSQTHNVSVGNVTEKTNYRASLGSTESKGMFADERLSKLSLDLKAGIEMNKYLSIDSKISLSKTKASNRPVFGKGGEVYQLLFIPNNIQLSDLQKYSDNDHRHINWFGPRLGVLNPYYINYQYTNMDERWRAFGYYTMKVNITPWLFGTAKYSFDYYNTDTRDEDRTNGMDDPNSDSMSSQKSTLFEQNLEFMLSGHNNINDKLRVGYTLGSNVMHKKTDFLSGTSLNMYDKGIWYHNSAQGFNYAGEGFTERETQSVFGNCQFSWDEYLSLDLTARNDWSSTLPVNNRSYFYDSANLSFVVTDFMQQMGWKRPSWLTFAKVRLSAAKVGKDTDPYELETYPEFHRTIAGNNPIKSRIKANSELKPEISHAYEAGLDMKFLNNRLGFDFTYYQSSTINQIMNAPMSGYWDWKRINAGDIENKGFEFMIYSTPFKTQNSEFNLNINFAHNNTVVKELNSDVDYISLNYKKERMLVDVGAVQGGRLGDIYPNVRYVRDENGNVKTRAGLPLVEQPIKRVPIGNIQPDLLMSVSPSFTYKGLSVSALFDMKFGGDIVSMSEAIATGYGTAKRTENRENIIFNGVDETTGLPNTIAVNGEELYKMIGGENAVAEEFLYDASYIKLKELSFGYSFSKKMLNKTFINSLRVSLVGRNLCYLLKHTPGTSPEGGFDTTMFSQAIDFTSVPYSRTFGFSINVGL